MGLCSETTALSQGGKKDGVHNIDITIKRTGNRLVPSHIDEQTGIAELGCLLSSYLPHTLCLHPDVFLHTSQDTLLERDTLERLMFCLLKPSRDLSTPLQMFRCIGEASECSSFLVWADNDSDQTGCWCIWAVPCFITPYRLATLTTYVSGETQKSLEVCRWRNQILKNTQNVTTTQTEMFILMARTEINAYL